MPTGAGLDGQLGVVSESTVGTKVTPVTKFYPFNSSELTFDPSYIEGEAIQAGQRFKDISLVGIARRSATGKIEIPVMMKGFGWLRRPKGREFIILRAQSLNQIPA